MISDIKRYSNIISMLRDSISHLMNKHLMWTHANYTSVIQFNDKLYGFRITLHFNILFSKKIACELGEDRNIYIGPELAGAVYRQKGTGGYSENQIVAFIRQRAFSSSIYTNVGDLQNDMDISYEDYEKNPELIKTSKPYLKIKKALEDITIDDMEPQLREGEFPKLNNRKMIPMFIINPSKFKLEYFKTRYVDSYRKGRESRYLNHISEFLTEKWISNSADMPTSLLEVKVNSKFIDN